MSAIKKCIDSLDQFSNDMENDEENRKETSLLSGALREISDRLDALEKKAHEPLPPMRVYDIPVDADGTFHPDKATLEAVHYFDTERSCMKCRSYNGCQATAEELGSALPEKGCADYEPKPDTEPSCDEPAQEQGGDDKDYDALLKKYQDLMAWYDNHSGTPCEQIRHEHEVADLRARLEQAEAKVKELTAELEKQKASAFETGELALKRGFEIERLEKEQGDILFLVQTRLQPPGSPCPGGPVMLVTWITGEAVKKIERLEKENAELKRILSEVKP